MDTEQIANFARERFDHEAHRRLLREKYQAKLIFGYAGGLFRATPELIVLLSLYAGQEIVVQDLYENPVKINATELLQQAQQRWQEQMNAWLNELEKSQSQR